MYGVTYGCKIAHQQGIFKRGSVVVVIPQAYQDLVNNIYRNK